MSGHYITYSVNTRRVFLLFILIALFVITFFCVYTIHVHEEESIIIFILSMLLGWLFIDLIAGFAHYLADNFETKSALFNRKFILPFREHHDYPKDITKHTFIETIGNAAILIVLAFSPLFIAIIFSFIDIHPYIMAFIISFSIGGLFSNIIHRYAHMDDPPKLVQLLQRYHIILPAVHHNIHHQHLDRYYCITNGWCNYFLHRTKLFERMTGNRSIKY